jgi:hypothetical protein
MGSTIAKCESESARAYADKTPGHRTTRRQQKAVGIETPGTIEFDWECEQLLGQSATKWWNQGRARVALITELIGMNRLSSSTSMILLRIHSIE